MTKYSSNRFIMTLLLFFVLMGGYIYSHAQTRVIQVHQVVVKTKNQRYVGILEKVNDKGIFLEKRNRKHIVIPPEQIKAIRIKPSRETKVITIPSLEPSLMDRNHDGTLTDAYLQNSPSVGEHLGHAVAMFAGSIAFDAVSHSLKNLKKFKINYSRKDYIDVIHELGNYSIHLQSSPEYELEALKSLQTTQ